MLATVGAGGPLLIEALPQPEVSSPIAMGATASAAAGRSLHLGILGSLGGDAEIERMSFPFGLIDRRRSVV
ncbi:MAG: hypothetical protein ACRDYY_06945 [Acidimicrobiales bacterium]